MIRFVLVALALLLASPAFAQSSKVTLDAEIDTNWPDNTSGAITPALLRNTVKDIVASYVDWLVCTAQGGIVYWNSTATPTCLLAGTSGQFLKTLGPGANPLWATPSLPASNLTVSSNNVVIGNKAGTNQPAQELTATSILDFIGTTVGQILNRGASIWSATSQLVLGASGTLGNVTMGNATSGTITVQPVAGALTVGDTLSFPSLTKTLTATIASGAKALNTTPIASTACNTSAAGAAGVVSTDAIVAAFNASTAAVAGYIPVTAGGLSIRLYPTNGTVNFEVCNGTAATITPGAITLNWAVYR